MRENISLRKVVCRGAITALSCSLGGLAVPGHGSISARPPLLGAGPTWPSGVLDFLCRWITQTRSALWGLMPTNGWVCFWVGGSGLVVLSSVLKWHGTACYQGLPLQLTLVNRESDKSCGRFNACWKVIFPTLLEKKSMLLQLFLSCPISTTKAIQHLQ